MSASDIWPHDDRELALLVHCARATIDPERASQMRALAEGGLDWARVMALAERNGLRPLLHRHLHAVCPDSVPAATLATLRDYFQKNGAFSLLLTGGLQRLLADLQERGIDAVPFKGPALAARLYGHVALRQYGDLDILVRRRDVWQASAALAAAGFVPDYNIPEARRAALIRQDYVQLFRRDAGRLLVELHWSVAPRAFAVRFDTDTIWPRLERTILQGQPVLAPAAEDLLLMLCVHGSRHGWDKLEGLASLAELVRSEPDLDWDAVWRTAGEMHCRRMLAFALRLVHGLFAIPLPAQAAALGASPRLDAMARRVVRDFHADTMQSRTFARQSALQLRLKDTTLDRVRSCARIVLTPTPDDWTVPLHGPLALAYPLVRAFRFARKYGLAHH